MLYESAGLSSDFINRAATLIKGKQPGNVFLDITALKRFLPCSSGFWFVILNPMKPVWVFPVSSAGKDPTFSSWLSWSWWSPLSSNKHPGPRSFEIPQLPPKWFTEAESATFCRSESGSTSRGNASRPKIAPSHGTVKREQDVSVQTLDTIAAESCVGIFLKHYSYLKQDLPTLIHYPKRASLSWTTAKLRILFSWHSWTVCSTLIHFRKLIRQLWKYAM